MGTYPMKVLIDEHNNEFVPWVSADCIHTNDGLSFEEKFATKIDSSNLKEGKGITITKDGADCTFDVDFGASDNIIDNLDTTIAGQGPLDARQGNILKNMIPTIVDNLTTADPNKVLSANQGVELKKIAVPEGGSAGQVLKKATDDNHSLEWGDAADPNAIVGDGSIMKIIELTYAEYKTLESTGALKEDTEYHIIDVENGTASYMTEAQIQILAATQSKEQFEKLYPVGSVIYNNNNINPQTYLGYGTWELTRTFYGGELVGYGSVENSGTSEEVVTGNQACTFADTRINTKKYTVQSYVPGVIQGEAGTISIYPKGIVGYVKAHVCISGYAEGTTYGFWFQGNGNPLPEGVSLLPSVMFPLYGCFPTVPGYGGAEVTYTYHVDDTVAEDAQFFVNPGFRPYPWSNEAKFYPGKGNVSCHLVVEVYAKGGTNYMWERIS
jgi:hypothetical protein